MKAILTGDPLTWQLDSDSAVTIGVFDGVHLGHQAVMGEMVAEAKRSNLVPVALTFDPHPLEFINPEKAPKILTTTEQRAERLAECGVEIMGVLPFLEIRDLTPAAFAGEILSSRCRARTVTIGEDFRFGIGRSGTPTELATQGERLGFGVEVVKMVSHGAVISSTAIRRLVLTGRVEEATELLGRPHEIRGRVIHGDGRGKTIGYPTANLHIPERIAIPADGVYAVVCVIGGTEHPALVNIGVRPTFGFDTRTTEVHVLDLDKELYGEELGVRFIQRLRDEIRFDSIEELIAQLDADVEAGRRILGR